MATTEIELAQHVIAYFKGEGWEVYQEVPFLSWVADIVVTKDDLIGVVECKQSYGFAVLEQGERWLKYANCVWVATWTPNRRSGRKGFDFGKLVAKKFGMGVITINPRQDPVTGREAVEPETRQSVLTGLKELLRPEHQGGYAKAGSREGARFTKFAATCKALKELVAATPGLTLKEAVSKIKHHYASNSSAVSSLRHWIEKGKVKGVKFDRFGRYSVLVPIP